jgi:hypothetical protein
MRFIVIVGLALAAPLAAAASELDDIKGWRATRTLAISSTPDFVQPRVRDIEQWGAWMNAGGSAKCEGAAGAIGHSCDWTDKGGAHVGKVVITGADNSALHVDWFRGDLTVANKGILSWSAADGGTRVTLDLAGTSKGVPKELKKTAGDVLGAEIDAALAQLQKMAVGAALHAADVAMAEKRVTDRDAAAITADGQAAAARLAWETAKAAADTATAAAARSKSKPALQAAAADATKAADAARLAADAAVAKATQAHADAEAARAEVKRLSEIAP